MIQGNENLLTLADTYPGLIDEFEKHGLGSYFKPENLKKLGRFTILSTVLKSKGINVEQFIVMLNQCISDNKSLQQGQADNLHLMAMLPCGLRNPFKEYIEAHFSENKDLYANLNYLAEGNVNHELSYYPLLDSITSADEFPDIIIASDVNNFFHRPFADKFLSKGIFQTYTPYQTNSYLEKEGYADPGGNFTMLTSNMLVMVVDKTRLGNKKIPERWDDLLSSDFENEIIMRGEDDFFCNAVMLPFCKDVGFSAIKILARNIKSGKHPAEMVKMASSGDPDGATVYIMPYFFAKRLKTPKVEIVWPLDGAIASPVFMLVKKDKIVQHKALLDFLLNKQTGEMLTGRYFPSIHPEVNHEQFPQAVKWLGWDFLINNNIGKLKDDIRDVFMEAWNNK